MTAERPTYCLRLRPEPNVDAIRALRSALKFLLRRCGMRAISVEEEKTNQVARLAAVNETPVPLPEGETTS